MVSKILGLRELFQPGQLLCLGFQISNFLANLYINILLYQNNSANPMSG